MKELALTTPTKDAKKVEKLEFVLFDDAPYEESLVTVDSSTVVETDPEDAELEDLRKQFVGDIHITEGSRHCCRRHDVSPTKYST